MIEITAEPIDIQKVIDAANSDDCGAVNTFIGTVRNHSHGKAVVRLEYEAYPEMAGKMIQRIIDEAKKQWPVRKIAVSHRVGVLDIGETWSYTASHSVTQAQIDDGNDLVNTVTVGTAEMGASAGSASATTTIGTSPALAIVKSHVLTKAPGNTDPGAEPGDLIAYSYAVTNTGNLTFNNVWVSDAHNGYGAAPVPAGEALTGDGGMPGDSTDTAANDGNWAVLAPGDTVTFAANYTVVQADVDNLQ